ARDFVEQRRRLNGDDEQKNEGRKHVDDTPQLRPDIGIDEVDRDVRAAVRGGGNTPEDQDPQQQSAEIVAVGYLNAEEVAQQNRDEDIGGDHADKKRGDELDRVDEAVHTAAPEIFNSQRNVERFRIRCSHGSLQTCRMGKRACSNLDELR